MKRWRGSSVGPDWTDVVVMMREIEKVHVCTCHLHMSPAGRSDSFSWRVLATAQLITLPIGGTQPYVTVGGTWPHKDHSTLPGYCFALLVKLDWDIGSDNYRQDDMFAGGEPPRG